MKKENPKNPHWDLMLATVKEVATLGDGSVTQLEQEFLEEFGHLPTSDLIDYFVSMQENKKKRAEPRAEKKENQAPPQNESDPETEFADKIALAGDATILIFRKSFEVTFGKKPSLELVAYFLKRLAYHRNNQDREKRTSDSNRIKFIQRFVSGSHPTILDFRREYEKKFGQPPNPKIIEYFLEILSKK